MAAKTQQRTIFGIVLIGAITLIGMLVGLGLSSTGAAAQPKPPTIEITPSWTIDGLAHLAPAVTATISGVPECSGQELLDPADGRILASVDGRQVYPSAPDLDAEFADPDSAVFHATADTIVAVLAWPALDGTAELSISCGAGGEPPVEVVSMTYTRPVETAPFSVPIAVADGTIGLIYHVELDVGAGQAPTDVSAFSATLNGAPIELTPDSLDLIEPYLSAAVPAGTVAGLHVVEVSDGTRSATFPVVNGISPDASVIEPSDEEEPAPDSTAPSSAGSDSDSGPTSASTTTTESSDSPAATASESQESTEAADGSDTATMVAVIDDMNPDDTSTRLQLLLVGGVGAAVAALISWVLVRRAASA